MAGHLVRINSILTRKGREQGEVTAHALITWQVVVDASIADLSQMVPTVTSVYVEGLLENPPKVSKQKIELQVEKVIDVASKVPHRQDWFELLRDLVHLQPRKNTIAAVARIRSALAYATRTFFYLHEFLYMDTPVFTTIDCEGAAEMFRGCTRFLC
ncbi:hypothetical protein CUMW_189250 [Citrus unshiu]|nr:hypothetical protein CUMW_189250 [Citrus unshiu]